LLFAGLEAKEGVRPTIGLACWSSSERSPTAEGALLAAGRRPPDFSRVGVRTNCWNQVLRLARAQHLATLGESVLRSVLGLPAPFLGAAFQGLELCLQVLDEGRVGAFVEAL